MFQFKCKSCSEWHEGMPTFGADAPLYFYSIPAEERSRRCVLGSDTCVVDQEHFFVLGCLGIHVHGETDPFVWGVWVSLSKDHFDEFLACFDMNDRSHIGPSSDGSVRAPSLSQYGEVSTQVHLRDNGIRPYIELEPTDHPLAVEQRNVIDVAQ